MFKNRKINIFVFILMMIEVKLIGNFINYTEDLANAICENENRYYRLICDIYGNFEYRGNKQDVSNCIHYDFPSQLRTNTNIYAICNDNNFIIKIPITTGLYFDIYINRQENISRTTHDECMNVIIPDIENTSHYSPIQYHNLPITCEEGYRLQEEYSQITSYCYRGNWHSRTSIVPCIQDCQSSDYFLDKYKLDKFKISETYYLTCKPEHYKEYEHEIKCSLNNGKFDYLYGDKTLKTYLEENDDIVCVPNNRCRPITSNTISKHIMSTMVLVTLNSCDNKQINEICDYMCGIPNTEKVDENNVICYLNEDGKLIWSGMAYCRCSNKDQNLNSDKTACECVKDYIPNIQNNGCEIKKCKTAPEKENNSIIVDGISECINIPINGICDKYICPLNSYKVNTAELICNYPQWSSKYHCECVKDYIPNIQNNGCEIKKCKTAPEKENNSIIAENINTCENSNIGEICNLECPKNSHKVTEENISCKYQNKWSSKYNCQCNNDYLQSANQKSCESIITYNIFYIIGSLIVLGLLIFSGAMLIKGYIKNKRKEKLLNNTE